jgi:hypothetical protein
MTNLHELASKYRNKELTGDDLSRMVLSNEISKSERRKVVKIASKPPKILSQRQMLRQEVKMKKMLPKISSEERKRKYLSDIEAEREKKAANFVTCLGCRKRGHNLKNCPNTNSSSNICFNCSSSEHSLRHCTEKRDPSGFLPYAKCFICYKMGHLSKDCAENPNGLYPKGGCCHICLQKTHLVKDCPERTEEDKEKAKRQRLEEDILLGPRIGFKKTNDNEGDDFIPLESIQDTIDERSDSEKSISKKSKKKRKTKLKNK